MWSKLHSVTPALLKSDQKFIEIEAWLFLTFSICLRKQLGSIHSIVAYL